MNNSAGIPVFAVRLSTVGYLPMSVFKKYKGKRIDAKDKNWSKGIWYVWKRVAGSVIHKSLPEARTKEQAEHAERKLIEAAFNQKYGVNDTTTKFKDFAEGAYTRYYEQHNKNLVAKRIYVRNLVAFFKTKLLVSITPQDCRDCQWKLSQTTSNSSVNRHMSTLSKLFTLACEEGILDRNPMQYVKTLKEPPARSRLLSAQEKENLWNELQKDTLMLRLVTLACNLPLRRGQLLAITPDAIDLQNELLFTIESKGRSSRVVPLNSIAKNTLIQMIEAGQLPFPLKDIRKRWIRITVAAGINSREAKGWANFNFHDLRKEFASELIKQNVNPNIVQKLFAHSDMRITNIYMHSELEALKQAVNTLDARQIIDDDVQPIG